MNKKTILIILTLLILVLSACSKIDSKNEQILTKVLKLENISLNEVSIKKDTIFVSIEASGANEYDTQIINWWGTIFGISSMLKSETTQQYKYVIIENTVNKEPYTYISANMITILDYNEDVLTDVEFWQETLITNNKPSISEIKQQSGLPNEALRVSKDSKTQKPITLIIILIIILTLVILLFKNPKKLGKIYGKLKHKTQKITKKSKKDKQNKTGKTIKDMTNKIVNKTKSVSKQVYEKTKKKRKKSDKKNK